MKKSIHVFILLLLASLTACSHQDPPLRVGLLAWPPYELVYVAEKKGYYENDRVEIVEFQSPAEAWRAYTVGSLDVVALTLNYVLEISNSTGDDRVFLIVNESHGSDAVVSKTPLDNLQQLRDMRIGLEPGPLGIHMLRRMLEKAELTEQDVNLVYFDIPDQETAYKMNEVDVMVTYEPVRTNLLKQGGYEIFSSKDIPGEIVDVFIARDALVEQRMADFKHFTQGWFQAVEYLQQQPDELAQLLAARLDMSSDEVLQALKGVHIPNLKENNAILAGADKDASARIERFVMTLRQNGSNVTDSFIAMFTNKALPATGDQ